MMKSDFYLNLIAIHMKKAQTEQQVSKLRQLLNQLEPSEIFPIMHAASEKLR